jgi:hypothetical protein
VRIKNRESVGGATQQSRPRILLVLVRGGTTTKKAAIKEEEFNNLPQTGCWAHAMMQVIKNNEKNCCDVDRMTRFLHYFPSLFGSINWT